MKINLYVVLKKNNQFIPNLNNKQLDLRFPGIHPYFEIDNVVYEKTNDENIIVLNADLLIYKGSSKETFDKILSVLGENQLLIYPNKTIDIKIKECRLINE